MMRHAIGGLILMAATLPATAGAQSIDGPVVEGYGRTFPTRGAAERPDPTIRYRVVFDVTKAAPTPDKVAPSLEAVARFLNLLAADGIRPRPGDVVAIVHGRATPIVATTAAYTRKTGANANPNLDLISRLRAAGVTVAVCDQALLSNGFATQDVADGVRVDVSALTTLSTLQLQGWALIPD